MTPIADIRRADHIGIALSPRLDLRTQGRAVAARGERIEAYARKGFDWAWPNVLLGALVIVPVWFVVFLFRPPGESKSDN